MLPPIYDAHDRLAELVGASRASYAGLSRMIGRPEGFLRRFAIDRVPSRLRDGERQLLAAFFGVGEEHLGGRPAPPTVAARRHQRRRDWYEARS